MLIAYYDLFGAIFSFAFDLLVVLLLLHSVEGAYHWLNASYELLGTCLLPTMIYLVPSFHLLLTSLSCYFYILWKEHITSFVPHILLI